MIKSFKKSYILAILVVSLLIFYQINKENFKPHNSSEIPPLGLKHQTYNNKDIIEKIESIPIKKFSFQTDKIIPVLKEEETRLITNFIKNHFPKFLNIVSLKKEQQQNVKRYDVVFFIKDTNGNKYNHVILSKIVVKDGKIFFNNMEYGGMILPQEIPSKEETDNYFVINKSPNKIMFLDNQIEEQLDNFEKRKIQILLRRGRGSA